jgi:hypothetical protein
MALDPPQEIAPGRKHFPRPDSGFLSTDEFISLYDAASGFLHTRNPYGADDPAGKQQHSVAEWIARIQKLLAWHRVQLLNGSIWIVRIPNEGDVQAWPASPLS